MKKNDLKKRLFYLLSAGVVLVNGTACSSNSNHREDSTNDYAYTGDDISPHYRNVYDINRDGELTFSEYTQYRNDCKQFLENHILEGYTEGDFGPFNYFGIDKKAYQHVQGLTEAILGCNLIDFESINQMYLEGQYGVRDEEGFRGTSFLDISKNPEKYSPQFLEYFDKSIGFQMADGSRVLMFAKYNPEDVSLTIEQI